VKICLITSRLPPNRCGVGDYSVQLGNALTARGNEVVLLTARDQASVVPGSAFSVRNTLPGFGIRSAPTLWREINSLEPDVILVQWVPFLYSRTGTNLSFPLTIAALAARGFRVRVMVHEPWVRFIWWSYFLTGPVQRLALGILATASQKVSVSISPWRELLRSRLPWKRSDIDYVPVGSNIPFVRVPSPGAFRSKAGIPDDAIVLAMFSLHGAAKAFSYVESAWRTVTSRMDGHRFHLVLIGASAEEAERLLPEAAVHARCHVTGPLPAADVSAWLQSVDLLLAPFSDGMTTRRTTVMAAMAHGVPVVSTRGRLTDPELFDRSPLVLTDLDADMFARAVVALIDDPARRIALAGATRAFYDRHFSWTDISQQLIPEVEAAAAAIPAPRALKRGA
jgi:glycosyltransferase involved in cell wall biosynthesis